jgi:hypothetical protein
VARLVPKAQIADGHPVTVSRETMRVTAPIMAVSNSLPLSARILCESAFGRRRRLSSMLARATVLEAWNEKQMPTTNLCPKLSGLPAGGPKWPLPDTTVVHKRSLQTATAEDSTCPQD